MNYSFYVNMSKKEIGATRKVQTLESFARTGTNPEKVTTSENCTDK